MNRIRSVNQMALAPPLSLLCKLGSIAVHVEEALSPDGRDADRVAIQALLADGEVQEWLAAMDAAALLPLKRAGRGVAR